MKATDFRDMTWERLTAHLPGLRERVYKAWLRHGPCTTELCAFQCGMSILTVRPRTTELVQMGLVEVVGRADGSGEYRAVPLVEAERQHEYRRCKRMQPELELGGV